MKILSAALLVSMSGCSLMWPNPRKLHFVGYIERDCSQIRNSEEMPSVPIGVRISPVQAAAALPGGCMGKFFLDVYADAENYYFFNNMIDVFSFSRRTAAKVKRRSYVVSAHSGELVRSPAPE